MQQRLKSRRNQLQLLAAAAASGARCCCIHYNSNNYDNNNNEKPSPSSSSYYSGKVCMVLDKIINGVFILWSEPGDTTSDQYAEWNRTGTFDRRFAVSSIRGRPMVVVIRSTRQLFFLVIPFSLYSIKIVHYRILYPIVYYRITTGQSCL